MSSGATASSLSYIVLQPHFVREFDCPREALRWFMGCSGQTQLFLGDELIMSKGVI